MKKTVLTFGLIGGAIMAALMFATLPFVDEIGFDKRAIVGYTTMVLTFMLAFFGIRSYRENVNDGHITLKARGINMITEADESSTGPASFMIADPDGNTILVDQHV